MLGDKHYIKARMKKNDALLKKYTIYYLIFMSIASGIAYIIGNITNTGGV